MTDHIFFRDEFFEFDHNGAHFNVHTEVGNGQPTRVVVQEIAQDDVDQEPSE